MLNSEYDILIYLTSDGIDYFDDIKIKKDILPGVFNVNISGGQINVATDNGQIIADTNEFENNIESVFYSR